YQSNLNGVVRFDGKGISEKDFKLVAKPRLGRGNYSDWRFDRVEGEVTFDAVSVDLNKVAAWIGDVRASANGLIMYHGRTRIDFSFDAPNLQDLERDYRISGLGGEAHATGRVEYSDGKTRITTEAYGKDVHYKSVRIGSLNLGLWLENQSKWSGSIKAFGDSLCLAGFTAEDFLADVTIDEPRVDINNVLLARDDGSRLGLVGAGEFRKNGFDLTIEKIFAEIKDYVWENSQPVLVSFDQGDIRLEKLGIGCRIGNISLENLVYSKGNFSFKAQAQDLDLELLGDMLDKHLIGGFLGLDLEIAGSQEMLDFSADLRVEKPIIQSLAFDLLSGQLNYKDGILSLKDLSLLGEKAKAHVSGWMPVDLSPSNLSIYSREKRLSRLVSEIGRFEVKAEEIDASMLGLVVPALGKFKGLAEINLVISGNLSAPRIVSEGGVAQATYGDTRLGEMRWSLIYEDSLLQLVEVGVSDGKGSVKVNGVLPVVLRFDPMEGRILDQNINILVNADEADIGLLCEIIPKLKVCTGSYWADLRIAGRANDILLYGFVRVENGEFRVEGVAQRVRNVSAYALAEGKVFYIDNFVAENGAIRGSGHVAINGSRTTEWDIRVDLRDYYVGEYEDFVASVAGRIDITGESVEDRRVIPKIEGNLIVKGGEYYYTAPSGGGGEELMAPTASPLWLMNIQVEIPNDFWIRGGDIEAELQGDLRVKRTHEGLVLLGMMKTLRGRFFVYHNVFRITKGEFRFSDVKSISRAYIDLEAESRVLDEMVKIRANGNLDNLSITATSESGWSETQIFEALTLRRGVSPEEPTKSGFFSDALLRSWAVVLANQVSEEVARELKLDRFGIDFGDMGEGDALSSARLTLGKYVMNNIYLEYSQALGSLYGVDRKLTQRRLAYPERQFSVEYRLSNKLSVEGETGTIGGLGYFEVDLKLRWEY
ncbi:MAG: translocation/assembly module TamB domain-containing protein, partial [bacterium]